MIAPAPWDVREPITDALQRHGLRDEFYAAVSAHDRETTVLLLFRVGIEAETAFDVLSILIAEGGRGAAEQQ